MTDSPRRFYTWLSVHIWHLANLTFTFLQRNLLADVTCHSEGIPSRKCPLPAPATRRSPLERFVHVREHGHSIRISDAVKWSNQRYVSTSKQCFKDVLVCLISQVTDMAQLKYGAQYKNRGGRAITSVSKEEAFSISHWLLFWWQRSQEPQGIDLIFIDALHFSKWLSVVTMEHSTNFLNVRKCVKMWSEVLFHASEWPDGVN